MFIGRKKELAVLEQAFHSSQSALIPIYGRRRVGKSELILKFLRDKLGLYYLGKKAPAQLQIREFLQEAARNSFLFLTNFSGRPRPAPNCYLSSRSFGTGAVNAPPTS